MPVKGDGEGDGESKGGSVEGAAEVYWLGTLQKKKKTFWTQTTAVLTAQLRYEWVFLLEHESQELNETIIGLLSVAEWIMSAISQ